MAVCSRQGLITELLDRTELVKAGTQAFLRLTDEQLTFVPAPGQWSIMQVFAHLNLLQDRYIRTTLSRVTLAPDTPSDAYHTGWLGDLLYERTIPRPDGSIFKMKALKSVSPDTGHEEPREVIHQFQRNCDALDDILRHVARKDLQRIKIPFLLLPVLKIRVGDILRFLVAHGERHLLQAQRIVPAVG